MKILLETSYTEESHPGGFRRPTINPKTGKPFGGQGV